MMRRASSLDLVDAVSAGEPRAIARMLSRAESGAVEARSALDLIYQRTGRAHVVGITGVPGSGKSTLVAKVAAQFRTRRRKVGIIAIDPSSPFSGGSILGDRIRMGEVTGDPGVFVRSMATRGALGGLARGTLEAVDILDAAGYEVVIIETVGVGQDEVDIVRAAHTTVVVSAPGLGDDIQAIKAGVLEIADIHAVSKGDKPEADKTVSDLKGMLGLGVALAGRIVGRLAPVVKTCAPKNEGIAELVEAIDAHREYLASSGELEQRRQAIRERRTLKAAEVILHDEFENHREGRMAALLAELGTGRISPQTAARRLLAHVGMEASE
ncbi:MAG: methylmalonyl Co-A mutase-associated GTPase MeaB [Betaproteobacteria bacterium]|nr:methylmalonyl Co-A mutase-associated GTPase MeaB [Betaproteobacteria bacterium]MDE2209692.1 methylmalonyl Co-A mutase-associated GTPase MeaB [Betaproteobacteria bacterium]